MYPEDLGEDKVPVRFRCTKEDCGLVRWATVAEHEANAIMDYWVDRGHAMASTFPKTRPEDWEGVE